METTRTHKVHRIVHGAGRRGGHGLIPEILQIGWGKFAVADPKHLAPHRHEGAFELCLIVGGEVEWETRDQSYVLRAGDVFVTRPSELHWGRDSAMQPCTLYWLHLDAQKDDPCWSTFTREQGDGLRTHLARVPRQLRGDTSRLGPLFQTIFDEHGEDVEGDWRGGLRQANARAALHQLIVEVLRLADRGPSPQVATMPTAVERAIALIRAASPDPLTNREVAASVGVTVAHLNELFVAHLGVSLTQFSLRERVRVARALLRESGQSVTDIANTLGFSSSQHFATAFKRMTGTSPSTYRSACPR